jgi:succinate dehydrogenase / fumarate reductase cytochrome b subunit
VPLVGTVLPNPPYGAQARFEETSVEHSTSGSAAASGSFFSRHDFLLRRLHSLSGLIPVGAYMVVHLLTNASVLNGAATFQNQVDTIHSLGIVLPLVEWTFIFIPLLFHAIFGFLIIRGWCPNSSQYPLQRNIRYTLQRATGMIAFGFILYHVWQLHAMGRPLGGGQFDTHHATSSAATAIQHIWVQAIYAVGVLACVYHLANGLWTMGITWGVWTSPMAQKRADYVCAAFGVGLAIVGLSALFGMSTVDVDQARAIEQARIDLEQEREERIEKSLKALQSSVRGDEDEAAKPQVVGLRNE